MSLIYSIYVNVTSLKTAKQITNFVLHKTKKKKKLHSLLSNSFRNFSRF